MSDIYSQTPFAGPPPVGRQAQTPQAPVQQTDTSNDISGQWKNFLADPGNRAALIQFGVQLMQPIAPGQSGIGHLGQAIGAGGEAQGRVAAEESKQREEDRKAADTESKTDLRTSQAIKAEAQATAAGARAGAAGDRAALQTERLQTGKEQNRLTNLIRAQNLYRQDVASIRKTNTDNALLNPKAPQTPEPSFEDWLKQNPALGSALTGSPIPPDQGATAQPAGKRFFAVPEASRAKYPDARQAPDGKWYVER